jgi:hypothetical protein
MRDSVDGIASAERTLGSTLLQRDLKRAFNWTARERSLRRLRSAATWANGSLHSGSRGFADTEGVTGSNPVAPTRHNVSKGPPLSAACQQIVSRSLLVTVRTL